MTQCQCLTSNGKGRQCSRMTKEGERFCYQHKTCGYPIAVVGQTILHGDQPKETLVTKTSTSHVGEETKRKFQRQERQRQERLARQEQEIEEGQKLVRRLAKELPDLSAKIGERTCTKQTQKKYLTRPSPPFPANECCGQIMMGNDGQQYVSQPNVTGVCRWKLVK
jgi:hypothetical protein